LTPRGARAFARLALLTLTLPIAGACALVEVKVYPLYGDQLLTDDDPEETLTRSRIESPGLRTGMFLVNWVPNLVSNGVVALFPGNIWPIQYLMWPFSVAYWGTHDAWHGYPFWEPTAVWD
jgi:hypothetical protein